MSSVEIKFAFDSLEEAVKFMAGFQSSSAPFPQIEVQEAPPVAPPPARKQKVAPPETKETAPPAEDAAPTPKVEAAKEEPKAEVKLDYAKDIGPRIAAFVAKGPEFKERIVNLLARFGVKSGRELTPDQFVDFSIALSAIE